MAISNTRRRQTPMRLFILVLVSLILATSSAWEWTDYLGRGDDISFETATLTMEEVREMRVRDIKRRLSRSHGYSADELGRMLDKKELIQALSFEEHKDRQKEQEKLKRFLMIRGIIIALVAVVAIAGWPVWSHLYAVASVNLVVYIDKKRHETSRCIELASVYGMLGVALMAILDVLSTWLTVSVLLSWFTSSKYFFPTPNLSIRPAQFMGDKVAGGPLGKYGMNVGPMAITWVMRFVYGKVESYTGSALSRAFQSKKKEARQWESEEERAARKATRKAARKAAREEAELKQREKEEAETKRRKEAADKATEELFGPSKQGTPPPSNDTQEKARKEFQEQMMENLDMDELD